MHDGVRNGTTSLFAAYCQRISEASYPGNPGTGTFPEIAGHVR